MTRALIVLVALVAGCCTPRVVERPVLITPPACRATDAPLPPAVDAPDAQWSSYHVRLEAWVGEVMTSCPLRARSTSRLPIATDSVEPWQAGYP